MSTRMSSADAAWLHMDRPSNLMIINSVLLFDEPIDVDKVKEVIAERRREPGDDLVSRLVTMEVEGRPLTDDELVAVMWNLIGGGVDTTTSLTSLALVHLSRQPELRERLAQNPVLLASACEEYLRWTSVNETLSRTCTRDTTLGEAGARINPHWRQATVPTRA